MGGRRGRFWPFGARAAFATTPVVLVVALVALAVLRSLADWPDRDWDGWLLLGVVVISLLPILLLVLEGVESIEYRGAKVAFAAVVQDTRSAPGQATIPRNVGLSDDADIADSGNVEILDGLRRSAASQTAVIDLEDGTAWWETRLLVLAAGAIRLGRPAALVFVATEEGTPRRFQGWARPTDVVHRLTAANAEYHVRYQRAQGFARRWELAMPRVPGRGGPRELELPWPGRADMNLWNRFPGDEFVPERLLAAELSELEHPRPIVTVNRLRELLLPVWRTAAVDETADDQAWLDAVLGTTDDFVAVTHRGVYVGLMARATAVNALLAATVARPRP